MTLTVRLTPPARAQFLAALAYMRADRPDSAVDFRRRVDHTLPSLAHFPNSGRRVSEFPDLEFREAIVAPEHASD